MRDNIFKNLLIIFIYFATQNLSAEEVFIKAQKIELEKDKKIIYAEGDVEIFDKMENTIYAKKAEYDKLKGIVKTIGPTKIITSEKYEVNGEDITYDDNKKIIYSQNQTIITDIDKNRIVVDMFNYLTLKNMFFSKGEIEVTDKRTNQYLFSEIYIDEKNKKIVGSDIKSLLNDNALKDDKKNQPRFYANSATITEKLTVFEKGVFTSCKKREGKKCPPWAIRAEKIQHDNAKKTIYYSNAVMKIYDFPVFYFPKFFHPDPTVKRQSGFLIPRFQDNSTTGLSFTLPYFFALAENRDITLTPRIFNDDKFLIQSEFREKNKKSNHIVDVSQFMSNNENSKGHLFYNFEKSFNNNSFDDVELNIKLEQVTDETYLKSNKIESPIINNFSNLTNSLSLQMYNDKVTIDTNLDVYEDLTKNDSDKYEYVPNFSFSKIINDNYSFNSNGYYKNYNTNITEKVLINNFDFQSDLRLFETGLVNEKIISIKNVNSDSTNSTNFKNESTANIIPTFQTNYIYPLNKETSEFNNLITPKLSLRLSLPSSKDVRKKDRSIGYSNIYDLDRLGMTEASEGGVSATYGYEFVKIDKSNFDEKIKFGFANNVRFEENKDLPASSNLGDKVSDFVGLFDYKYSENLKFNYDFSLKNNLEDKNYELFGFEYYLSKLSTKFEYLNKNNSNLNTSYLKNETRFNFDEKNSLIFETSENKEKSFTEFYNLIYQYENDCLKAGIEYNKEYYSDRDLKPSENLFFKITILPFGGFNTPNLK